VGIFSKKNGWFFFTTTLIGRHLERSIIALPPGTNPHDAHGPSKCKVLVSCWYLFWWLLT